FGWENRGLCRCGGRGRNRFRRVRPPVSWCGPPHRRGGRTRSPSGLDSAAYVLFHVTVPARSGELALRPTARLLIWKIPVRPCSDRSTPRVFRSLGGVDLLVDLRLEPLGTWHPLKGHALLFGRRLYGQRSIPHQTFPKTDVE